MNEGVGKPKVIFSTVVSKIQVILGVLVLIFCGLGIIGSVGTENFGNIAFIVVLVLLLALGVWLVYRGRKKGRLIKRFQQYVAVLSGDPVRSLDNLAAALGESVDSVRGNVEQMIKLGFMVNAYINRDTNCVVFAGRAVYAAPAGTRSEPSPAADASDVRTVVCKGCGATNKIPAGGAGECEFCGSRLT